MTDCSDKYLILVGSMPPPRNGQSVAFQILVEGLDSSEFDIDVVNISGRKKNSAAKRLSGRLIDYLLLLPRYCLLMLRRRSTKLVYLQIGQSRSAFARDFVFLSLARLFGAKQAIHLFGGNFGGFFESQPPLIQRLIKHQLSKVSKIFVESRHSGEAFRQISPDFADKICVVPNGMENLERDNQVLTGKKLDTSCVRLLYLSNLIESKGYIDVLRSASELKKRGFNNFKLDFAGAILSRSQDTAPNNEARFCNLVDELGLNDHVRWHGVVESDRKTQLLLDSHFFLLPSWYVNEGQPLSILEAMAFGVVCIVTDYRAIPEMVINGETGIFVPARAPQVIADEIESLCRDPSTWESMSTASINRFQTCFTRETHLKSMSRELSSLFRPQCDVQEIS